MFDPTRKDLAVYLREATLCLYIPGGETLARAAEKAALHGNKQPAALNRLRSDLHYVLL